MHLSVLTDSNVLQRLTICINKLDGDYLQMAVALSHNETG